MQTIFYVYFGPVIGLVLLLFMIQNNHLFDKRKSTLFTIATMVTLMLIFTTSMDFLYETLTFEYVWVYRRITSFVNFAFGPSIPLLLLIIFRQKKNSFKIYIPLILNVIICFASIFAKVVFFIDKGNQYDRGPLFFVPIAVIFIYLMMMLIRPDDFHRQGRKTESTFMVVVIALTTISIIMEVKYYFVFMNYVSSAICLILFYILKNIHYFMIDPLTGAYNRQVYERAILQLDDLHCNAVVVLDINDFKEINDTYGHEAGDKALALFADILHRNMKNIAVLYRVGGDEFALLAKKDTSLLQLALDKAELEAQKNNLEFAYGVAEYHKKDDVHEVLRNADKIMYINKNNMKKNTDNISAKSKE